MLKVRFFPARLRSGLLAVALLTLAFAPLHSAHSASKTFPSSQSTQLTLADLPDEAQAAISAVLQRAKLTASDGAASDQLGASVAISGDGNTLVVGAPWGDDAIANQGAAYVFTKPGGGWDTTSTYTAKLTAYDGRANDWFGVSVAISADGNAIVVGASNASRYLPSEHEGLAYVFVKPGGGWVTTSSYTAELASSIVDAVSEALFGWSVAVSGNGSIVVVGTPLRDYVNSTITDQGAAYLFYKPGGGWGSTGTPMYPSDTLSAVGAAAGDQFGHSVAISGNGGPIIVGASAADINGKADQGAAYLFAYETPPFWSQYKLTASDGAANDWFGISASISGDGSVVVVGANGHDFGISPDNGAAYVFVEPFLGWTDMTETTGLGVTGGGAGYDEFGNSVAISADGNAILVGAYGVNAASNNGAAYLFVKPGAGWGGVLTPPTKLTASDGAAGDGFGNSVSIGSAGNALAVGARSDDIGVNADQGSAYVYEDDTTPPNTTIDSYPPDPSNDHTPTFTFSGDDGAGSGIASFMCQMDGSVWSACASPFTSPLLADGYHIFEVYAIDRFGNVDPSPAHYDWTITTVYLYLPLILR